MQLDNMMNNLIYVATNNVPKEKYNNFLIHKQIALSINQFTDNSIGELDSAVYKAVSFLYSRMGIKSLSEIEPIKDNWKSDELGITLDVDNNYAFLISKRDVRDMRNEIAPQVSYHPGNVSAPFFYRVNEDDYDGLRVLTFHEDVCVHLVFKNLFKPLEFEVDTPTAKLKNHQHYALSKDLSNQGTVYHIVTTDRSVFEFVAMLYFAMLHPNANEIMLRTLLLNHRNLMEGEVQEREFLSEEFNSQIVHGRFYVWHFDVHLYNIVRDHLSFNSETGNIEFDFKAALLTLRTRSKKTLKEKLAVVGAEINEAEREYTNSWSASKLRDHNQVNLNGPKSDPISKSNIRPDELK